MAAPFQWSLAALETLMAEDQMDQHAAVLRAFSVVELWRPPRTVKAPRFASKSLNLGLVLVVVPQPKAQRGARGRGSPGCAPRLA